MVGSSFPPKLYLTEEDKLEQDRIKATLEALPLVQQSQTVHSAQTLRIEALRAAATIVAGSPDGVMLHFGEHTKVVKDADGATIKLAGQFVRWLETGER